VNSGGLVIFVDDEEHVRRSAQQALELAGFSPTCLDRGAGACDGLSATWPGVLIVDVQLPDVDGLSILRQAVAIDPQIPVVLVTGHGDISMAVEAMRAGAYDFVEKPYSSKHLAAVTRRAMEKRKLVLENRVLRTEFASRQGLEGVFVGETPAAVKLRQKILAVASTDADVLVMGETGTGKELVARCLHEQSRRSGERFVPVNCGALPEALIESDLFGHEEGAFTGASRRRIGKFEYADGGTIFLDEIESMAPHLQVRLLRVLQERVIERLGSNEQIPVDVRVVAAAKRDLLAAASAGDFRDDLFYRLNVARIDIPPLRDRLDDIPLLFHRFLADAAARYRREPPLVTAEHLHVLLESQWRGNVRELQNAAERFVLGLEDAAAGAWSGDEAPATLGGKVEVFERAVIEQALKSTGGSVRQACETLGMPRNTLYDKMKKYGLSREQFADD
jgi:two-component system C4-dicarboxylate transport response regulator DctD